MKTKKKSGVVKVIVTLVVLALLAGGGWYAWQRLGAGSDVSGDNVVYVTKVSVLTGEGGGLGILNRFSGVIEAQETWSVEKNSEGEVAELYVKVGDEVHKGTPLFIYDVEKYQNDLAQSEIDLERLKVELESMDTTIEELKKEKEKAKSGEQANYTIQIQSQELEKKQREYDVTSKEKEIEKLKDNIKNATVYCEIDGVVQSIKSDDDGSSYYYGSSDNAFIKVMKTGAYRVMGTINEQNIYDIYEGMPMIVHSRVDDTTWKGTIASVDRENAEQNNSYYDSGSNTGSKYPFYVDLEVESGVMLGQHVYMEADLGQENEDREGLWLDSFYIADMDTNPYVWARNDAGKIEKRSITTGTVDEATMQVEILSGLTENDAIAFPSEALTEGLACVETDNAMLHVYGEDAGYDMEGEDYTGEGGREEGMGGEDYAGEGGWDEGMDDGGMMDYGDDEFLEDDSSEDVGAPLDMPIGGAVG